MQIISGADFETDAANILAKYLLYGEIQVCLCYICSGGIGCVADAPFFFWQNSAGVPCLFGTTEFPQRQHPVQPRHHK